MRGNRLRPVVAFLFTMAAVGCGNRAADAPAPPQPPPVTVHEWGLIAHHYRDSRSFMAAAVSGGARHAHAPVMGHGSGVGSGGKPVIYVRTRERTEVSIRVGAPGGAIIEHLPPATTASREAIEWSRLVALPRSCPTGTRVTPDDPRCATPDGYCEALENPDFDSDDASCLTAQDGAQANHLFYRAQVAVGGLPLLARRVESDGTRFEVENASDAPIESKLLVVWRSDDAASIALLDPPAPHRRATLPVEAPQVPASRSTSMLRGMLVEAGLTVDEASAFLRAWDASIFGQVERATDTSIARTPPAALRQTPLALYYFAPEPSLAAILPLDVTPAPAAVVRAILVKVDLFDPPEGTAGLGIVGTLGADTPPTGSFPTRIRFGASEVSGGLMREVVQRIVRSHTPELRACAETHRTSAEDEGHLVISFDVDPTGRVGNVAEVGSTLTRGAAVSQCVTHAVARWRFPRPENAETAHVTCPILITNATD